MPEPQCTTKAMGYLLCLEACYGWAYFGIGCLNFLTDLFFVSVCLGGANDPLVGSMHGTATFAAVAGLPSATTLAISYYHPRLPTHAGACDRERQRPGVGHAAAPAERADHQ
jgi:hypothetical protein